MHLPEALYQDTKELERPRSALVLPAAIYPLLVVVLPFVTLGGFLDLHWGWLVGGFGVALGWAVAAGFVARSPKPLASARRLLGWAALWCVEPFFALYVLGPIAGATHIGLVSAFYVVGTLVFGYAIFRHYRGKK